MTVLRRCFVIHVLLMCLAALTATVAVADEERTLTTPTGWWWLYGVGETDINNLVNNEGARVIDIEVQSTNPIVFAAVFVHNSGDHARNWWWYYGQSAADVINLLNVNNARLIDIERYFDAGVGADRFAVVMVENTGGAAKGWWWYLDASVATLDANAATNNARLVDIDRVSSSGNYDGIMISNTGADASGWWHLYNVDATFLQTFMSNNSARIFELEMRDTVNGLFDCVLIPISGPDAIHWWWYYGVTESQLSAFLAQNGARLTDLETWFDGSTRRFSAVMVNNSNDLTTRIADILDYGADGATGLYLKQVNGPTLASLQQGFVFEPASSIKVTHHLHAMRQVMMGLDDLSTPVVYSINYTGSCPIGGAPFQNSTLGGALQAMMWFSDNAATEFISDRYGPAAINATSSNVALMTNTSINHTPLGCGGAAVANPNDMTLEDAGMLHERVANGIILDAPTRETFYDLMQSEDTPAASQWWFTTSLRDLIYEEATNLGVPGHAASYWANTRLAWKPGGYGLNGLDYVSVAGWVSLPYCGRTGLGFQEYVFGVFVHGATDDNGRVFSAAPELFREQIREGLRSCPTDAAPVVAVPRLELLPNVPNPFNPRTTLVFSMPEAAHVRLSIFDVRGQEIAVVLDEMRAAGTQEVDWDGRGTNGERIASGAYFARVVAGNEVAGRKIVLAK